MKVIELIIVVLLAPFVLLFALVRMLFAGFFCNTLEEELFPEEWKEFRKNSVIH